MKKTIFLFFLIMFMIGTDTFLISPLLPTLQELYNVSTEISGWMVSAYALGYAIFALIAGPISDGLDRKRVIIGGMIFFSISTFLCGIAPAFWWMITFRFLAGVSAAFVSPQVWASIPLLVSPQHIMKCIGIVTAGLSLSQMFGLPIGAYLASIHYSTPFFVIGICSAILGILIYFTLPHLRPLQQEFQKQTVFSRYNQLLHVSKTVPSFFAYFLFQTGNFAAFSFLGKWLSDQFQLELNEIGIAMLILGFGNLTGNLFGVKVVNKFGKTCSLYGGIIVLVALYLILPHLKYVLLIEVFFFIIFFITGILFAIMMSALQTLSQSARGTIAALTNSSMYIGQMIGAALAGFLYVIFHNFSAIGMFTASMYIFSLFMFKRAEIIQNIEPETKQKIVT
ncbi:MULTISPECIES: MFS transporter [unclassified Bacillus (in: firmicutes)]|uniref:MFS transporter n=1 Tax=unclassified Bacillus (in: firmicutes) TaxID=185979 RepID=UPI00232DE62C|nr:MFS transporter [Bacillus sp. BP-3]MDC2866817.1 MFS transporter [Bacillus sp. BP-3]